MFEGVFSALVTPFKDGRIDVDALERLIEQQIAGGVHGVVPCGTTGESATLTPAEHKALIRDTVRIVAGRVPVLAGTGSNATAESIELTRAAREAGAAGALLIAPYYNKPGQEGLYRHYRAVAEAVDLPLVLYDVPGRTGVTIAEETVRRLSKISNIVAIKEASANMERASWLRRDCAGDITLISGDDATFLPFLSVGGAGIISVAANVAPARMVALWQAWNAGDVTAARRAHESLLELNRLLFVETNPIPVKAAVAMLGLCGPEIRLPLTPMETARREDLRQAMVELELLLAVKG